MENWLLSLEALRRCPGKTDEISKFGAAYMGYEASDTDGNTWVLGLRHIETKSADNTLKVFKELTLARSHAVQNGVSRDILQQITATISDRAATENKFNDILKDYRQSSHKKQRRYR